MIKKNLRFVIIPKVVHPWFDEVLKGAQEQAKFLENLLGIKIEIDYQPPSIADIDEQNSIFGKAIISNPDGIAIDPLDTVKNMHIFEKIKNKGIPVIVFDSPYQGNEISSVGNDFAEQGTIAAERLVKLLGEEGKVAVMKGVPNAPNHKERYDAQIRVLERCPRITILDGGIDNDNIMQAEQQASGVIKAFPDLKGYLCCDASGPLGIAEAIKKSGMTGKIKVVSMDGITPIPETIKEGIFDSSASTKPRMQGSMSILMLWQASNGIKIPQRIDTGIDLITLENVDNFINE
jgi:ribose transport system substrate-binding protein